MGITFRRDSTMPQPNMRTDPKDGDDCLRFLAAPLESTPSSNNSRLEQSPVEIDFRHRILPMIPPGTIWNYQGR